MKLNHEELGMGAAFSVAMWPLFGFFCFIPAIATALLWALGGSGIGRVFRFAGCPAVIFATLFFMSGLGFWSAFNPCFLAGVWLTFGYGIPDPPTRPNPDKGSGLGRIFYKAFKGDEFKANVATRAAYAAILSSPFFFLLPETGWIPPTLIALQVAAAILIEGQTEI